MTEEQTKKMSQIKQEGEWFQRQVSHRASEHLWTGIVPSWDVVPLADVQTGLTQTIQCDTQTAGATLNPVSCHMLEHAICQLLEACGDGEHQRFNKCKYDFMEDVTAQTILDWATDQWHKKQDVSKGNLIDSAIAIAEKLQTAGLNDEAAKVHEWLENGRKSDTANVALEMAGQLREDGHAELADGVEQLALQAKPFLLMELKKEQWRSSGDELLSWLSRLPSWCAVPATGMVTLCLAMVIVLLLKPITWKLSVAFGVLLAVAKLLENETQT